MIYKEEQEVELYKNTIKKRKRIGTKARKILKNQETGLKEEKESNLEVRE